MTIQNLITEAVSGQNPSDNFIAFRAALFNISQELKDAFEKEKNTPSHDRDARRLASAYIVLKTLYYLAERKGKEGFIDYLKEILPIGEDPELSETFGAFKQKLSDKAINPNHELLICSFHKARNEIIPQVTHVPEDRSKITRRRVLSGLLGAAAGLGLHVYNDDKPFDFSKSQTWADAAIWGAAGGGLAYILAQMRDIRNYNTQIEKHYEAMLIENEGFNANIIAGGLNNLFVAIEKQLAAINSKEQGAGLG